MAAFLALRLQSTLAQQAADTHPSNWREDDLSVKAFAATETQTRMSIWEYDREYRVPLDPVQRDPRRLRPDRFRLQAFVGCPILVSHSSWSTSDIVGMIDEGRLMRMDIYEIARELGAKFGVPAAHVAAVIEVENAWVWRRISHRWRRAQVRPGRGFGSRQAR